MLRLVLAYPLDAACFGSLNHIVTGLAHLATRPPCGCYREQGIVLCPTCRSEVESQPLPQAGLTNVDPYGVVTDDSPHERVGRHISIEVRAPVPLLVLGAEDS